MLREPVFLFALALLVVNDHWLKHSGLLPGWLTGKLSDFAGLIVAPLLLVTLLGARGRRARLLCFVAVSTAFVALELSPPLARSVEQLTRAVHLSWRLWSDPTDLLALSAVPLAWRTLHAARVSPAAEKRATWLAERAALVTASVACLATSEAGIRLYTAVALVSAVQEDVPVQVFRPASPLDCDAVAADPESALSPAEFELDACTSLVSFELLPLDVDGSERGSSDPPPRPHRACDAVLLRAPGLQDTVVFWNDVPQLELESTEDIPEDPSHLVYLERVGRELFITPPAVGKSFLATSAPPATNCEEQSP